ncbi:hypothetical protein HZZ00_37250 (plasmid) [Streptomyces sp. NEAU-sy36]|nr:MULTISPECIES: hypothetical protein [unclassified Streptomyces]QLJ06681.1 hypothetical protein HZZ00_37250 [Streptomyces sp. NEAU-sy36]
MTNVPASEPAADYHLQQAQQAAAAAEAARQQAEAIRAQQSQGGQK